jgi:hypothetical protein
VNRSLPLGLVDHLDANEATAIGRCRSTLLKGSSSAYRTSDKAPCGSMPSGSMPTVGGSPPGSQPNIDIPAFDGISAPSVALSPATCADGAPALERPWVPPFTVRSRSAGTRPWTSALGDTTNR